MNRNVESHFAVAPSSLDIKRSQFDRSSSCKTSFNVGELIPFYVDEVLPGDTFKIQTSKVVRLQTLVHPIMDNMYLDTYYFFVPNRLVWDHWKQFCGESNQAWTPNVEYTVPKLNINIAGAKNPGVGSLADYMGIPTNIDDYSNNPNPEHGFNALPFRAYAKICDDWFRSETLTDPLVIYTGDDAKDMNAKSADDIYCALGGPVFHVAKYHDYFTSCLPAPQCGPSAKIPVSGYTPVGIGNVENTGVVFGASTVGLRLSSAAETPVKYASLRKSVRTGDDTGATSGYGLTETLTDDASHIRPINLWADISGNVGTINDLRVAFQVQKFYEKMSYGRRYIEVLKSQFGVTSPDARLQRSEYLGGNRIPINVSEVTNNAQSAGAALGNLGAMSRTVDSHYDFVHSFTEHGFVIGVCCVRYDHTYGQGVERFWTRTNMFDYYWPVFANIGEQAVTKKEIYFDADPDDNYGDAVFGYQEAFADYRYKPNRVSGEMRPSVTNSLASWHLADDYETVPTLSDSWIREDKTNVDRCLAVTSATANQIFADFYIKNICTRPMPVYSIPGLADHH